MSKQRTQEQESKDVFSGTMQVRLVHGDSHNFAAPARLREFYRDISCGPEDWAAESEVRLAYFGGLKTESFFAALKRDFAAYETDPKIKTPNNHKISALTKILDGYCEEMKIPPPAFIAPTPRNYSHGGHAGGPVAYHANILNPSDRIYADIFNLPEVSMLKSFRGALESLVFIAAQHYQFQLAADPGIGADSPTCKIARLFEIGFRRESRPETFPWRPDEKEKWLNEPGMRHALYAVKETMALITGEENYEISPEFMAAWDAKFHRGWQVVLLKTQASDDVRLKTFEDYLARASDDILRSIDKTWRKDMLKELREITQRDVRFKSRAGKIVDRLVETAPDRLSCWLYVNRTLPEVLDLARSFNRESLREMDTRDRVELVNALITNSDYPQKDDARRVSIEILRANPYCPDVESEEDELIMKFHERTERHQPLIRVREAWQSLALSEKIDAMHHVIELQAKIFGREPAEEIVTYDLSRAEYERIARDCNEEPILFPLMMACNVSPEARLAKIGGSGKIYRAYPGMDRKCRSTIAVNRNEDALKLYAGNYVRFKGYIVHEQTHHHQFQGEYKDSRLMADIAAHRWLRNIKGDSLSYIFYRLCMSERHAFANQGKAEALDRGEPLPSESSILDSALCRAETKRLLRQLSGPG